MLGCLNVFSRLIEFLAAQILITSLTSLALKIKTLLCDPSSFKLTIKKGHLRVSRRFQNIWPKRLRFVPLGRLIHQSRRGNLGIDLALSIPFRPLSWRNLTPGTWQPDWLQRRSGVCGERRGEQEREGGRKREERRGTRIRYSKFYN